jgi:hypothetical protein
MTNQGIFDAEGRCRGCGLTPPPELTGWGGQPKAKWAGLYCHRCPHDNPCAGGRSPSCPACVAEHPPDADLAAEQERRRVLIEQAAERAKGTRDDRFVTKTVAPKPHRRRVRMPNDAPIERDGVTKTLAERAAESGVTPEYMAERAAQLGWPAVWSGLEWTRKRKAGTAARAAGKETTMAMKGKTYSYKGVAKTVVGWAEELGVRKNVIYSRLAKGETIEQAIEGVKAWAGGGGEGKPATVPAAKNGKAKKKGAVANGGGHSMPRETKAPSRETTSAALELLQLAGYDVTEHATPAGSMLFVRAG